MKESNFHYTGCLKKWGTFENAVIRNGKQVDLIFSHDLDK